jgi:hypothetical protein
VKVCLRCDHRTWCPRVSRPPLGFCENFRRDDQSKALLIFLGWLGFLVIVGLMCYIIATCEPIDCVGVGR